MQEKLIFQELEWEAKNMKEITSEKIFELLQPSVNWKPFLEIIRNAEKVYLLKISPFNEDKEKYKCFPELYKIIHHYIKFAENRNLEILFIKKDNTYKYITWTFWSSWWRAGQELIKEIQKQMEIHFLDF